MSELTGFHEQLAPEHIDALTGLANRAWLNEHLPLIISENSGSCGLLFVDLDGLKLENDKNGHDAGDEMIKRTASALEHGLRHTTEERPSDIVTHGRPVRLGGDEFVAILLGVSSDSDVQTVKERVQEQLTKKGILSSIGGALHDAITDETSSQLLKRADNSMYKEKVAHQKERFTALPKRKRIAARVGHRMVRYAGINPPRQ